MPTLLTTLWRNPRWQLASIGLVGCALVVCGVVLATTLNLAACPLCILQRMLYLLLGIEALLLLLATRGHRLVALLMAVTAATGAGIAGYQTWLQRFAQGFSCGGGQPWWEQLVAWAGKQVPLLFEASGLCSEAGWVFLGLSIAEWSLLFFSAMTLLALRALSISR
ncbi:MAG: disulfide bond formation protein B [Gammaproteobacteria bacterium]|nr:disulfide bond formation protein B [Rhodocyclaceae bacterium]MBU3910232.1 disulfide bond formation protein B [Gammaproteobacteria bacterium]MBU3990540.1 disulfide bond formation protein B [Gammaproteobacteria bacterium]MBU4004469.1 disulfide bond formation protein B [Gammaproteobacteria bacterium]MBU4022694.1 disulfide bond formation protein B [Gammaproteobacteria bacterium]